MPISEHCYTLALAVVDIIIKDLSSGRPQATDTHVNGQALFTFVASQHQCMSYVVDTQEPLVDSPLDSSWKEDYLSETASKSRTL